MEVELRDVNDILIEMATIYARLINQYKFKYQCVFSAVFDKKDEDGLELASDEMFISLKINQNLTRAEINKINIESQLKSQIENQEMKESGWRFNKINSMTIFFYKTTELSGSSYVKIPIRTTAILNIQNDDKYCFIWSILAHLHPVDNHSTRVTNYEKYFNELKIDGFDFSNGFKSSDVHKFEKLNNLSINIFELIFYRQGNVEKHKLVPVEISKNNNDNCIDLMIYKNHYVLIKKLHVFLGKEKSRFVCRRCLSAYTTDEVLQKHKQKCE